MEHWTEVTIIRFLRKLETFPCLWNTQDSSFRSPSSKASALTRLSRYMNFNGYGADMMERKMMEIRSTYIREKRRMYELRVAGRPFHPRFRWYHIADDLWGKVTKIRKFSYYTDEDLQPQSSTGNDRDFSEDSTGLQRQDDALAGYLGKAVNAIRHITALSSGNEFDAFGRSVACQLKGMQTKGAYELQSLIQRIISEKKIRCLAANPSERAAAPATAATNADSNARTPIITAKPSTISAGPSKEEADDDVVEIID